MINELPEGDHRWIPAHQSGIDEFVGRIYESYVGLRGQLRVAIVDRAGRVHHWDAAELVCLSIENEED